jgi:hypothetical protein
MAAAKGGYVSHGGILQHLSLATMLGKGRSYSIPISGSRITSASH